jgi:Flp pilus assembly protein CpaB
LAPQRRTLGFCVTRDRFGRRRARTSDSHRLHHFPTVPTSFSAVGVVGMSATATAVSHGNGQAPPGRTIKRRVTLPAGRAVVGGFLVAVAATGVFAAYTGATTAPQQRYVVARRALAPGVHLTAADLALAPMDLPTGVGFRSVTPLLGATVVGPVGRGELIQAGGVIDSGSRVADRQLSIPIDSSRAVSGDLRAGDRVDVAATFGSGQDAYTVFVVRNAQVLSRQQSGSGLGGTRSEVIVVSLPSSTDALAVSHAISVGQLSVVRATGALLAGDEPYRAPATPAAADPGQS